MYNSLNLDFSYFSALPQLGLRASFYEATSFLVKMHFISNKHIKKQDLFKRGGCQLLAKLNIDLHNIKPESPLTSTDASYYKTKGNEHISLPLKI